MIDVQLLDVFSEVEALLRSGREIQRDALHVRNAAPTTETQRRAATRRMQKRVGLMREECQELCDVLHALADRTSDLRATLDNRQHRRHDDAKAKH